MGLENFHRGIYYVVVIRKSNRKGGSAYVCKSREAVSELSGVSKDDLDYRFGKLNLTYWEFPDPWAEVWLSGGIYKQNRRGNGNLVRRGG